MLIFDQVSPQPAILAITLEDIPNLLGLVMSESIEFHVVVVEARPLFSLLVGECGVLLGAQEIDDRSTGFPRREHAMVR